MPLTPFHGPPARPPAVPGFMVGTLLGTGAHGEVWAAREQITGDQVALKIGHRTGAAGAGAGPAGAGAGEAELLARLDHPHLVRLRRVVPLPAGGAALVLDLAAGGSLGALVARRGPLDPGEVVTMLVPLATVLAELHGQGVVHGDLAPGNVLFADDGRPLLGDLGVSSVLGSRTARAWSTPGFADPAQAAGADPRAGDVWGLGAVAWFALTGRPPLDGDPVAGAGPGSAVLDVAGLDEVAAVPVELVALIRSCLSARPAERPELEQVAQRAWAAAPPRPIRLSIQRPDAEADPPRPSPHSDGASGAEPELRWATVSSMPDPGEGPQFPRPGRRRLAAVVIGCLVTGAAVVAVQGKRDAPGGVGPPASVSAGRSAAQDEAGLTRALEQIAAARAQAFGQVSTTPLAAADEPGSPAERMDAAVVERLAGAGVRLDGVSYRIGQVRMVARTAELVDVKAVVTTSGHRQVSTTGEGSRRMPPVGPELVRLRLVRADQADQAMSADRPEHTPQAGWLVRSVEAVSG